MGKKIKQKKVIEAKKTEYYKKTDTFGNIEKLIYPNTLQVGLKNDIFNSTISGSIHHTRQGISYLVAGSNIQIVSGSNGQVTISATAGAEGTQGDTIYISLKPQSVVLAAGSNGAVTSYSPAAASIQVLRNGTALETDATSEYAANTFRVSAASGTRITPGSISHSSTSASIAEPAGMSNSDNDAFIDFTVIVQNTSGGGSATYSITQTIGKAIGGTDGNDGNDGAAGLPTPNVSLTRPVVTIGTDATGGAFDDGGDLSDDDISNLAFTKIDANVGTTNVTFAGHNESGNPTNNTYKIVTDSMTATTDNGTALTVTNSASEGAASYDITCANNGNRLKLAVTTVSNDAQIRIASLAEHEDASNTDFDNIVVTIPVKITTAVGTQTITRSFTVQKIKKGTSGDAGSNGSNGNDGNDGATGSGVVVSIDPATVTLPATSDGTVSNYTASGATIKVHENGTAINVDTSLGSNSRWFVFSATGSSITAGSISQTNGQSSATIADASSISATTATIAHVVRVKNSLGVTTDYTVTQTLTKAVAGSNGSNGSNGSDGADATSSVAIFSIRTSGGAVDLGVLNGANVVNSLSGQENVPFDNTVLENTNVATNSSGTVTLAASSTYKVDTSVSYETKTGTGSDAGATYRIDLELSTNGGSSYSSIGSSSDFKFKNAGTGAEGQNQLAGIFFSASANNLIRVRLIKGGVNGVIGLIDADDVRLSIISIEKLS